jgi:hypothetical protein
VAGGGPSGGSSFSAVNEAFSFGNPTPPPSDTTAPTVIEMAPASGAANVPVSTDVTATFSEAMDPATINGTSFTLLRQGTTIPVAATVTYNAAEKKAILDPGSALAEGAIYTATLKGGTSGVKDLAGNALATDKSWSFTTAASALSAPSNLSATRSGNPNKQRIDLSWMDNSNSEAKFVIERSTTPFSAPSNLVSYEVGPNTVVYRDSAVQRNTTYHYRVFAVSSTGAKSASSNVVSVTTR